MVADLGQFSQISYIMAKSRQQPNLREAHRAIRDGKEWRTDRPVMFGATLECDFVGV